MKAFFAKDWCFFETMFRTDEPIANTTRLARLSVRMSSACFASPCWGRNRFWLLMFQLYFRFFYLINTESIARWTGRWSLSLFLDLIKGIRNCLAISSMNLRLWSWPPFSDSGFSSLHMTNALNRAISTRWRKRRKGHLEVLLYVL